MSRIEEVNGAPACRVDVTKLAAMGAVEPPADGGLDIHAVKDAFGKRSPFSLVIMIPKSLISGPQPTANLNLACCADAVNRWTRAVIGNDRVRMALDRSSRINA